MKPKIMEVHQGPEKQNKTTPPRNIHYVNTANMNDNTLQAVDSVFTKTKMNNE